MYGFEPNEEQQMLIDAVRRYAQDVVRPAAHEADEDAEWSQEVIERGWQLGILQASVPEQFGGFGERSAVSSVLAAEELAWGDLAAALAVMAPTAYALPILLVGNEEQKEDLLPPVVEGPWKPFTSAWIEPDADFAPRKLRTEAVQSNGDFEINGRKTYVPFADSASKMVVYAQLEGETTAFVLPTDAAGVEVGERRNLMGVHALPVYDVDLNDVRVSPDAQLGGPGDGDALLASAQVAGGALAVGVSRAAYEYALDYAKQREAFGGPIAQKQAIAFMLAEMATEIEAIRLLVWEAAWKLDQGEQALQSAHLALTGAADMAMMVTDRAVQILGGHGYIREHPVERWMRNGRGIPALVGLAMV
ncbi:MAG: acyl-CoA dehydrogenase family protein [Anaerolineales bacterium]|nr:acyl-CoA dehydrogenase family protein [Anaerolineales bacterium]